MKRGHGLKEGCLFSLLLVLFFCVSGFAAEPAKPPLKFGYVGPMSGFYSHGGMHATQGIKVALDEVGWTLAGRKIELIIEDDGWDIGVGITKTKKVVMNDKVDMMLGPHNGQVILALRDFFIDNKMIHISPIADESALTRDKYSKFFFRANHDAVADVYRVAGYMAHKKGYRKVVYMGADFIPSRECLKGFREVFEPLGGKVTTEIYAPFGTTDFAPYFAKIDMNNTDAVYAFFFGGDAISFVKQWVEYGLKNRIQLLGIGLNDGAILQAEGDSALGMESVTNYTPGIDIPENRNFVATYRKKYGMDADFHADHGYVAAKVALLGLKEVQGNTKDVDKLIRAMEKVKFVAPRGPFRFGPNHAPIQNIYLLRIEKVDGKLVDKVIETYTEVEQGWMPKELRK
jgi:branched-chain amino acid transport system substrate-binding protein